MPPGAMSVSSPLIRFYPRVECERHLGFSRLRIICNLQPLPSSKTPRCNSHPLAATKSAPPVDTHTQSDANDDDEAAALTTQLYRGHLEELLSSDSTSEAPASTWWETLFPFLSSARTRGILLLNLLTILYGSNIPIIKEAEATTDPWLFLCGRFALATMVFIPVITRGIRDPDIRNASLELGLWMSLGYFTQSVGLLTSDAGRASFLLAFTVIAVPLLAGLSGRKISNLTWASAITAFVGVGLLETGGSPASVGDLWSFCSAVLFGVHIFRTEHYSRALISSQKLLPMLGLQLLVIAASSVLWSSMANTLLKGVSLSSLQNMDLNMVWQSIEHLPWLSMVYTGAVSTAFCLWIEMTVLKDISATDAAVIYSVEPLWGATFAWCFLGERWSSRGWLGALLVLGGSLAVQFFQAQEEDMHS